LKSPKSDEGIQGNPNESKLFFVGFPSNFLGFLWIFLDFVGFAWQERGEGEQIPKRDPADALERGVEHARKGRQRELDDAGVELAHERADAGHAHNQPHVTTRARHERGGRRLGAVADEIAQTEVRPPLTSSALISPLQPM
jgi:hypothetical protein